MVFVPVTLITSIIYAGAVRGSHGVRPMAHDVGQENSTSNSTLACWHGIGKCCTSKCNGGHKWAGHVLTYSDCKVVEGKFLNPNTDPPKPIGSLLYKKWFCYYVLFFLSSFVPLKQVEKHRRRQLFEHYSNILGLAGYNFAVCTLTHCTCYCTRTCRISV